MTLDRAAALTAWADTKWAARTLRTRADMERRQARLWARMAPVVAKTPAVAHLAGRPLADFPVVTPAEIRQNFDRWNTLGLTRAAAEAAAAESEAGGAGEVALGVVAGFSTGTSGERGLFLSSAAERGRYIGQTLARLLSARDLLRPWRVALVMRADNALYRGVEGAGRFQFRFIGLDMAPDARLNALRAFAPDILIAPAHVLTELAGSGGPVLPSLRRVYWGAEPMGEAERGWISQALGAPVAPIYQATEGFLGAPCRLGSLHLNEDSLIVELEPVEGTDRFRPVVTDLFRVSQPMIRVRLDDLIQPRAAPCPCGSPLRAIEPVEGRGGDLWRWPGRTVCPREVTDTLERALGPAARWQATGDATGVIVTVEQPAHANLAEAALQDLAGDRPVALAVAPVVQLGPKRRRVRWAP